MDTVFDILSGIGGFVIVGSLFFSSIHLAIGISKNAYDRNSKIGQFVDRHQVGCVVAIFFLALSFTSIFYINVAKDDIDEKVNAYEQQILDDSSSIYDQGYEKGYDEGYDTGNYEGEAYGYNRGYDDGYEAGYDSGYSDGSA